MPVPRDVMMLKAMGLPMLMRVRQEATIKITTTAFTGTSKPGRTLK